MEDEDYRMFELNGTHLKVFRDGRIHSLHNRRKTWTKRKYTLNKDGYYQLSIGLETLKVHNVISLCYLGERQEEYQIDHVNNVRTDNRLENLQYLPKIDNIRKRKMNCNGRPIKGYSKNGNKYEARIIHLGQNIYLGRYDNEEDARQAYIDAKLKYHNVIV